MHSSCTVCVERCDGDGWVVRCEYTQQAQCIQLGLQLRLLVMNNATALSKANKFTDSPFSM